MKFNNCAMKNGRGGRMLLTPWLRRQADSGNIAGLHWMDKAKTELRIPWMHASRHQWEYGDTQLFASWAQYTG